MGKKLLLPTSDIESPNTYVTGPLVVGEGDEDALSATTALTTECAIRVAMAKTTARAAIAA